MIKTFNNPNNLTLFVVTYRLLALDPAANARIIQVDGYANIEDLNGGIKRTALEINSALTDAQITAALANSQTQAEANAYAQYVGARAAAKAIPNWATYTEAEALAWEQTNIGARITTARSSLPTSLTLATTKTAILGLITILDNIQLLLVALIKMVIALRNKTF